MEEFEKDKNSVASSIIGAAAAFSGLAKAMNGLMYNEAVLFSEKTNITPKSCLWIAHKIGITIFELHSFYDEMGRFPENKDEVDSILFLRKKVWPLF